MNSRHELPDYLQAVVDEAEQHLSESDIPPSAVANEVATGQRGLVSNQNGRNNLEVLSELREAGYLCCDELDTYRAYSLSYDGGEATIEAIVIRSLEELLHESLQE
jgi:DNA-binding transcriptional ArsR family regulator